mgnify:CR=1 FL=1
MEAACPESELSAPAAMPQYDLSGDKMPFSLAFAQNDFNGFFLKGCKWYGAAIALTFNDTVDWNSFATEYFCDFLQMFKIAKI